MTQTQGLAPSDSALGSLSYKTPRTCIPCQCCQCAAQHSARSHGNSESRCSTPEDVYSSTTTIMTTHITFGHVGGGGGGGGVNANGGPASHPPGPGQNSYQGNAGSGQSKLI